jgi:hypothetical protein
VSRLGSANPSYVITRLLCSSRSALEPRAVRRSHSRLAKKPSHVKIEPLRHVSVAPCRSPSYLRN